MILGPDAGLLATARVKAERDGRTPRNAIRFAPAERPGRTGMDGLGSADGRDAAARRGKAGAPAGAAAGGERRP